MPDIYFILRFFNDAILKVKVTWSRVVREIMVETVIIIIIIIIR
jgi:hypothetical protein